MCIGPEGDMHGVSAAECAVRMARAGAHVVGINCHFDPFVSLECLKLMKAGLEAEGLKPHLMVQPLAFHTPDAGKQGFIDLPEFPFALEPRLATRSCYSAPPNLRTSAPLHLCISATPPHLCNSTPLHLCTCPQVGHTPLRPGSPGARRAIHRGLLRVGAPPPHELTPPHLSSSHPTSPHPTPPHITPGSSPTTCGPSRRS